MGRMMKTVHMIITMEKTILVSSDTEWIADTIGSWCLSSKQPESLALRRYILNHN